MTIDDTDAMDRYLATAEQADLGAIDLIAHANTDDGLRGFYFAGPENGAGGHYQSDRTNEIWVWDDVLSLIASGEPITFMSVPAGQGIRMGLDRDEDGHYDRSELDEGFDPADPLSSPMVAVGQEVDAAMIAALTQVTSVFPQPFTTRAAIEFYLPVADRAVIEVFDVSGRMVRRLADDGFGVGATRVSWDGRNQAGALVAPGAYLIQLRTSQATHTRKVVRIG